MTILHNARFAGWARGHLLCRVEGVADRFALTFDDGPSPRHTPLVLDVLRRHGARATFFTLAPNVRRAPALARRIEAHGHELAAHGDRHWPLPILPPWGIRGEVLRSIEAIEDAGARRPRFYRPPFGFMMPGQAAFVRAMQVEPVLGDVYPEDPARPGVRRIVDRVLERLRGGSILILHDGSPLGDPDRSQTVAALDVILRETNAAGLTAVTVDALVAQESYRWTVGTPLESGAEAEGGIAPTRRLISRAGGKGKRGAPGDRSERRRRP